MNESAQDSFDLAQIKKACLNLLEHFDTVQIFTSKMGENCSDTHHFRHGSGNWFARYGQIKAFISDTEKGYILGDNDNQEKNIKEDWE